MASTPCLHEGTRVCIRVPPTMSHRRRDRIVEGEGRECLSHTVLSVTERDTAAGFVVMPATGRRGGVVESNNKSSRHGMSEQLLYACWGCLITNVQSVHVNNERLSQKGKCPTFINAMRHGDAW